VDYPHLGLRRLCPSYMHTGYATQARGIDSTETTLENMSMIAMRRGSIFTLLASTQTDADQRMAILHTAQPHGTLSKTSLVPSLPSTDANYRPPDVDQANNSLATTGELINAIPSLR
jgi:hypothetical protein